MWIAQIEADGLLNNNYDNNNTIINNRGYEVGVGKEVEKI